MFTSIDHKKKGLTVLNVCKGNDPKYFQDSVDNLQRAGWLGISVPNVRDGRICATIYSHAAHKIAPLMFKNAGDTRAKT